MIRLLVKSSKWGQSNSFLKYLLGPNLNLKILTPGSTNSSSWEYSSSTLESLINRVTKSTWSTSEVLARLLTNSKTYCVCPPVSASLPNSRFLERIRPVSYTHLRAHETGRNLVCRLLLEKKNIMASFQHIQIMKKELEN